MIRNQSDISEAITLKNFEDRIVWIDDEIDNEAIDIVKLIIDWNKDDRDIDPMERVPIKLMFFTPGGSLDVNNAIIDVILLSKTPVYGYNMGLCQSAGAFIYLSCHKRYTMPWGTFLFHQGSGGMTGSQQFVQSLVQDWNVNIARLQSFLVERTSYTPREVEANLKGEWYIYSEEAIVRGVAEEIITNVEELF